MSPISDLVEPRRRALSGLVALLLLGSTVGSLRAQDVEVKSYLDRSKVALGQQFTLFVAITGSQGASAEPEVPSLGDFAIPLGSGSSSEIQMVNGQMTVSRTINFYFQASREGEFQIPAVRVRTPNGTLTTESLSIQIDPASSVSARTRRQIEDSPDSSNISSRELFLEASADKLRVYQGQAVVVTYDILTLVNVTSFSLVDLPSTQGFWVENYPIDQPQTRNEVVEGQRYTVATIKQMALIPTTPGSKTIEPLVVECEVRTRRRGGLFDDFFSDRMFRNTRKKRIASQPIEVEVLPLPSAGRPANFSGAVGVFEIESNVDKNQVEANQAITLTVTVGGEGNITNISDPQLDFPDRFEIYPPESKIQTRRRSHGIAGEKTFEYVMVPRAAGNFEIPALELSYFDPESEVYKTARSPLIPITATTSEDSTRLPDPSISKREVELLGEDIRFLKSNTSLRRRFGSPIHPFALALNLLAPLLLLGAVTLYNRHQEKLSTDQGYARLRRSRKLAASRLSLARKLLESGSQGDFYAEVDRALAGFAGDRLNLPQAGLISSQLQAALLARGVEEPLAGKYIDCMKLCQEKRFAPVPDSRSERSESLQGAETAIADLARVLEAANKGRKRRA